MRRPVQPSGLGAEPFCCPCFYRPAKDHINTRILPSMVAPSYWALDPECEIFMLRGLLGPYSIQPMQSKLTAAPERWNLVILRFAALSDGWPCYNEPIVRNHLSNNVTTEATPRAQDLAGGCQEAYPAVPKNPE